MKHILLICISTCVCARTVTAGNCSMMTNSPAVLLGKLRISSAPRELPHIPLEVAQQIARYLDHRSAFALTLTCRSLREAGETSLYESSDLTSGWGNDNGQYL